MLSKLKFKNMMPKAIVASMALCFGVGSAVAQGYYDDDLYYDSSKAVKQQKTERKKVEQSIKQSNPKAGGMYYYDGATYVPWDSVGEYCSADSYLLTGSSTRDVDEYNRHYSTVSNGKEVPDSITLAEFSRISNTEKLARFNNSSVAYDALGDGDASTLSSNYNDIYASGYSDGYNAGYSNGDQTTLSINVNAGWPYYYSSWGWPYYTYPYYWRYPYYSYYNPWYGPSWGWGWDYGWGPSWSWGWGGYPAYYPGYYPGGWGWSRPQSPSAAHRPRPSGNYRPSSGSRLSGNYRPSTGNTRHPARPTGTISTSRPGYNPPINAGGYHGGSSSGRNSHFGTSGNGSNNYTAPRGNYNSRSTSGNSRPSYNNNSNSRPSYNSNSSRGSYNSGSYRSTGGGGSRGGGGGHRSR